MSRPPDQGRLRGWLGGALFLLVGFMLVSAVTGWVGESLIGAAIILAIVVPYMLFVIIQTFRRQKKRNGEPDELA